MGVGRRAARTSARVAGMNWSPKPPIPHPLNVKARVWKPGNLPQYKACKGCKRVFNMKACKICPHCKYDNGKRNRAAKEPGR